MHQYPTRSCISSLPNKFSHSSIKYQKHFWSWPLQLNFMAVSRYLRKRKQHMEETKLNAVQKFDWGTFYWGLYFVMLTDIWYKESKTQFGGEKLSIYISLGIHFTRYRLCAYVNHLHKLQMTFMTMQFDRPINMYSCPLPGKLENYTHWLIWNHKHPVRDTKYRISIDFASTNFAFLTNFKVKSKKRQNQQKVLLSKIWSVC